MEQRRFGQGGSDSVEQLSHWHVDCMMSAQFVVTCLLCVFRFHVVSNISEISLSDSMFGMSFHLLHLYDLVTPVRRASDSSSVRWAWARVRAGLQLLLLE